MSYSGLVLVPPANTTFTTLNTNSLYSATAVGNNLAITAHCNSAGDNLCGSYVSVPSTPFQAIMCVACNPGDYAINNSAVTVVFGPAFYDGTKAVISGQIWASNVVLGNDVYYFSNATTVGGTLAGNRLAGGYPSGTIQWFMCRDDGTNIIYYTATDGGDSQPTHWTQLYSESRTSHFASGPTKVGFFCDPNGTTGQYFYFTLLSFQLVSL